MTMDNFYPANPGWWIVEPSGIAGDVAVTPVLGWFTRDESMVAYLPEPNPDDADSCGMPYCCIGTGDTYGAAAHLKDCFRDDDAPLNDSSLDVMCERLALDKRKLRKYLVELGARYEADPDELNEEES